MKACKGFWKLCCKQDDSFVWLDDARDNLQRESNFPICELGKNICDYIVQLETHSRCEKLVNTVSLVIFTPS